MNNSRSLDASLGKLCVLVYGRQAQDTTRQGKADKASLASLARQGKPGKQGLQLQTGFRYPILIRYTKFPVLPANSQCTAMMQLAYN